MATQTFIGTLVVIECDQCYVHYGITQQFHTRALEAGVSFHCPNGHKERYGKTENQQLLDKLARKEKAIESLESDVSHQKRLTESANNRVRGQKAAKTRLKNRIKNGVCTCCKRSFKNLRRHMKTKHPELFKKGA